MIFHFLSDFEIWVSDSDYVFEILKNFKKLRGLGIFPQQAILYIETIYKIYACDPLILLGKIRAALPVLVQTSTKLPMFVILKNIKK